MKIFKRVYQVEILQEDSCKVIGYVTCRLRGDGYGAWKFAQNVTKNYNGCFLGKIIRIK